MATCFRLGAILQTSYKCECLHLTFLRQLSSLGNLQGKPKTLVSQSQLTCLVCIPHCRQEVTFTKKRRRFVPRHKEDGINTDMTMIYENNMNRFNFWGQLIINTLAVPIYGLSINILVSNWPFQDLSITSGPLTAMAYISVYGLLLFGVNGLCRRSIRRIYTDKDAVNFAAVTQDWKMMSETVYFDLTSVQRKPPGNVFGSFFGNVKIRGRSYLATPNDFILPRFYNLLMGYDLQRSIDHDIIRDIDLKDIMSKASRKQQKVHK